VNFANFNCRPYCGRGDGLLRPSREGFLHTSGGQEFGPPLRVPLPRQLLRLVFIHGIGCAVGPVGYRNHEYGQAVLRDLDCENRGGI
jgi:hypothetical protein